MRYTITNLAVALDDDDTTIRQRIADAIGQSVDKIKQCQCVRRALDARKKRNIHHVCSYEFTLDQPLKEPLPPQVRRTEISALNATTPEIFTRNPNRQQHVIIVGAGPAGLFAALHLAEAGAQVTLLERGKPVEQRMRDIGRLRSRGELNPESNICFGEGGAGTYTDGKLYTRIKHPFLRNVLHTLVRFGAKPDILIDAHPHLGTDKLIRIVRNIRLHLLQLGVDYRFESRVDDLVLAQGRAVGVQLHDGETLHGDQIILATGHSARDTFAALKRRGVQMQAKPFAVGVRAEHPQALIDQIQFGSHVGHPKLRAAEYSLTHQYDDAELGRRGVYSFCMCPGGLILPSPTEPEMMAVNGMSNAKRAGRWANSGVVVQVTPEDVARYGIAHSPLMGVAFQRQIERAAFQAGAGHYGAPAMRLTDFIAANDHPTLATTRFKPNAIACNLHTLFPAPINRALVAGLRAFDRKMRGYVTDEANLFAAETRTSSPVRVERNAQMQSVNVAGLYPVGEGAGYAGGIVSAAVDGMKAAAAILKACV